MVLNSKIWNGVRTSYIFYTDDGKEHLRLSQPCYGELRKYEKTHPGDCTQPLDMKPGDLYNDFPEGNPTSVIFNFNNCVGFDYKYTDFMFEVFFGEFSPWLKGVSERTFHRIKGKIGAVQFNDGKFDPTIIVNLCKNFRNHLKFADDLYNLVEYGLTPDEATAVTILNGVSYTNGIGTGSSYSTYPSLSLKRFFGHNPVDLSGGMWTDRIDYNRKQMADVFRLNGTSHSWWRDSMISLGAKPFNGGQLSISGKDFVSQVKDCFAKQYESEPEPVNTPYIWETTLGVTNAKV